MLQENTGVREGRPAGTGRPALSRSSTLTLLVGPAFVAAIAYVDPGNVATNASAGARFGYLLVWVIVAANAVAMLVQYLSAKLSIATRRTLPELCRERCPRPVARGLWLQAEVVAVATDLAELIGGAAALQLLFGVPLVVGGVITGAVSWAVLLLQQYRGQRAFEAVVAGMLGVIAVGFAYSAVAARPELEPFTAGLVPRLEGLDSLLLAVGILGATVMPHAVYMHGALVLDRYGRGPADGARRQRLLAATRVDVGVAMVLAGLVNLAMLTVAAAVLDPADGESLAAVHGGLGEALGAGAALLFALALLASGFASTAVGTYAGSVIMDGFLRRRVPLAVRRLVTLVPALAVLAAGVEPGQALILSQVVLSFGIPFALWPLVLFTRDRRLMGPLVNRPATTVAAVLAAAAITGLNAALVLGELL
ncbi:Nramp family divalent metal transporter [Allonocardiopsis opalescens]|uniref:Manganese transport protein n=1 Tax=Allonocardiopsis opalescens TaxID=1144618 RepID=A0A2T0Q7S3_9ACTN|nr:Nramp family divalent metal transporter [Allonocardiopsis opalescens]PRX99832.1 manganese transport protein [Allonocardiopsis opalescens]